MGEDIKAGDLVFHLSARGKVMVINSINTNGKDMWGGDINCRYLNEKTGSFEMLCFSRSEIQKLEEPEVNTKNIVLEKPKEEAGRLDHIIKKGKK